MRLTFLLLGALVAARAFSADLDFHSYEGGRNPDPARFSSYYANTLHIKGPIQYGDYAKLTRLMVANGDRVAQGWLFVGLTSPGGDVVEAMRIADLLRRLIADVTVHDECLSACFLIWVGSAQRMHGSRIGIHRPYFEPRYFAGLSAEQARLRHAELLRVVRAYLEQSAVPGYLIERMFALPSNDLYLLTAEDVLRISRRQPWYEELLIARCNLDVKKELQPPRPDPTKPRWQQINPYDLELAACAESHATNDRRDVIKKLSAENKR